MPPTMPETIGTPEEFHRQLISALDDAYNDLAREDDKAFAEGWRKWERIPGTKTRIRQTPMLGKGASGRHLSGFQKFAKRYTEKKGQGLLYRCSFERYQDFVFYSAGNWYEGNKIPLMVAQVESNFKELLGELSELIWIRCPHKYLFIAGHDTLNRLTEFCRQAGSPAVDWAGTTYHVIEIPDCPSPPSTWTAFRASVLKDGGRLDFVTA